MNNPIRINGVEMTQEEAEKLMSKIKLPAGVEMTPAIFSRLCRDIEAARPAHDALKAEIGIYKEGGLSDQEAKFYAMDDKPHALGRTYAEYLHRAKAKGVAFISYTCPHCDVEIETRRARPDESWDSLTTCPHCGELHMKFTVGASAKGVKLP